MKIFHNSSNILILLLFIVISGCTKEAERDFPRVNTLNPGDISQSGAILRGEIKNFKSIELEDYGFMIGEGTVDASDELMVFSLGSDLGSEIFEGALTSGLEAGQEYYYLAYGVSNSTLSLGNEISFMSQGSSPPVLSDFSPLIGQVGDTVVIRCTNLYGLVEKYSVNFNQILAEIVFFSDTLIEAIVPLSLETTQSTISLTGYGSTVNLPAPFTLRTPAIESFSPPEVYPGEDITITGTNFHTTETLNKVNIGSTSAIVSASSKTELTVIAPFSQDSLNTITVTVSGQTFTTTEKIKVKLPSGNYFEPSNGTYGDEVHIHGIGLLGLPLETVQIGDKNAELISSTNTEIIVKVPISLTTCESEVKIVYTGQTIVMDYLFSLDPPIISGLSDLEVWIGSSLIILGENFSPVADNNTVIIGGIEITPETASITQLVITIDTGVSSGTHNVGVRTCGEYVYSSDNITINAPTWLRVADFPGGEAYKSTAFTIGDLGYAGLGTKINNDHILDIWAYSPLSNSWSIIPRIPGSSRILADAFSYGNLGIVGGGFDIDAPWRITKKDYYEYNSLTNSWSSTANYPGPTDDKFKGVGNMLNDAFHLTTTPDNFYAFDPSNSTWSQMNQNIPSFYANSSSFVIGNTMYIVGGIDLLPTGDIIKSEVWAYNSITMEWVRKNDFPGGGRYIATGFAIDGFGYFGLGYNRSNFLDDIWRYNPIEDSWAKISDFPGGSRGSAFCFIINGAAYIGTGLSSSGLLLNDVYYFHPGGN